MNTGTQKLTNPLLLAIVGPSGVGKTAFSLDLARSIEIEIISADSRLVYRGMDIGTDKPPLDVRKKIAHHLVDIREPNETITLGSYKRMANEAIEKIHSNAKLPVLVGGTGQYVWSVIEGWGIPEVPPQERLRENLAGMGQKEVSRWLKRLDPVSADKIDPRNVRRCIRALEVTLVLGKPISDVQTKTPPNLSTKIIGLTAGRQHLYRLVDNRVDEMIREGLLDEVAALHSSGYGRNLSSMSGLGYRQLLDYIEGELTLEEAIARIKYETHRFIRQQYTWFRLKDRRINWFDVTVPKWQEQAKSQIWRWIHENGLMERYEK